MFRSYLGLAVVLISHGVVLFILLLMLHQLPRKRDE